MAKLSEICDLINDKIKLNNCINENLRETYVSTENMLQNKAGITTPSSIPSVGSITAYKENDTLVSNIRPYFKKIWKAAYCGGCSNDVLVFRAKNGISADFLYYSLADDRFFDYSMQTSKGTKMPRGDKKAILEYTVSDLDLITQKKATIILSLIDRKIAVNNAINDNLTQQLTLVVDEFINDLYEYDLKNLSDIADCQNGYAFYKDGYDDNGAFVIDLGNVNTSATFVYTNADKYISLERYNQEKLEKFRVYKNDLVMVMTDRKSTMELLGKTGKIYKDGLYLLNQRMFRIRAKKGININYLYAVLNSSSTCNALKEQALGSVQKYINTGTIKNIKIKIPSCSKMEELSHLVDPISSTIENNTIENENLIQLRNSLLPKLMSGEIDVSNIEL